MIDREVFYEVHPREIGRIGELVRVDTLNIRHLRKQTTSFAGYHF